MRRYFTLFYWGALVPAVAIVLWTVGGWAFADRTPTVSGIVFLIWGSLILLAVCEWALRTRVLDRVLDRTPARDTQISFISDRRKVTVYLATIVYIESRDSSVLVWTSNGRSYPTRMKISQWEYALDDRFVRVHRSFIVSRAHISRIEAGRVWLSSNTAGDTAGDIPIEISRKYRGKI